MNATVHGLVGACIYLAATKTERRAKPAMLMAGTVSLVSHIPLDAIPHIEPASFASWPSYIVPWSPGWLWAWADNLLMVVVLLIAAYYIGSLRNWGAVVAVGISWLPDFVQWSIYKGYWTGMAAEQFTYNHNSLHMLWRTNEWLNPWPVGWSVSLCAFMTCSVYLFDYYRHQNATAKSQGNRSLTLAATD